MKMIYQILNLNLAVKVFEPPNSVSIDENKEIQVDSNIVVKTNVSKVIRKEENKDVDSNNCK